MKTIFEEKKKKQVEKLEKKINISKKKGQNIKKIEAKLKKMKRTCNKENCARGKCAQEKCTKEKSVKRVKIVKKNLFESDEDTSEGEDVQDICDDESVYSEEEGLCAICRDTGKDECWYRCRSCGSWAHQECSGSEDPAAYICAFCLNP